MAGTSKAGIDSTAMRMAKNVEPQMKYTAAKANIVRVGEECERIDAVVAGVACR